MRRVGLIGFGYIGANVYAAVSRDPTLGLEPAFVFNRSRDKLAGVPPELVLDRLDDFARTRPDLIVEMSHPSVTVEHGARFLERADYLPLSVTALADDALRGRLLAAAERTGHKLLVPHGALMGADSLFAWRHMWRAVTITFRKHPRNIDFRDSGLDPAAISGPTVLYEGPVRGIARRFPRNVNTMVTCALATIGLDRCTGILIADPALEVAIAHVVAEGMDGSRLEMEKVQPAVGVSGTEMFASQFRSIRKAAGAHATFDFV